MNKINELKNEVLSFVKERDWQQFHNPKDLVQALSIEVSELSELFLWTSQEKSFDIVKEKREEVSDEMADIFSYLLSLSNVTGIDLEEALKNKINKNKKKYPAEKVKGSSKKYTDYKS
jgi:NTP pyrophosphatase (non-canonical NTP hydrolase)